MSNNTKPFTDSQALTISVILNALLIGYALFTMTTTFQLWYNGNTKAYHSIRAVENYLQTQGVDTQTCESTIGENKYVTITCADEVDFEYEVPVLI